MSETIASPVIQITASTAGLDAGIAQANRSLETVAQKAAQTSIGVNKLGVSFEKLGQTVRTLGAMSIAIDTLANDTSAGGSAFENAASKVQAFALAAGSFAGPKGQIAAVAITGMAEAAKWVYKQFNAGEEAQKRWAAAAREAAKAAEQARKPIESMIAAVEKQVATFGMGREAIEQYELAQINGTRADKDRLETAQAQRKLLEDNAKIQEMATDKARRAAEAAAKDSEETAREYEKAFKQAEELTAEISKPQTREQAQFSNPSILGAGSAGALLRIQELTNAKNTEDKKQTDLLRDMLAKLKEIAASFGGTDQALNVVDF